MEELRAEVKVIHTELGHLQGSIDDVRADVRALNDRVEEALHGNGHSGLSVRMDRLEQSEAHRQRTHWMVVTTTTGLVLKTAWEWAMKLR